MPFDALPPSGLDDATLDRYDVVILPAGSPARALEEGERETLEAWLRDGGTLVAYESSARWAAGAVFDVGVRRDTAEDSPEERLRKGLCTREERRLASWERRGTGIVRPVEMDPDHPLTWGATDDEGRLFVLHRDDWTSSRIPTTRP